ncbi:hypothetical protein EVAR_91263_1 [Eumeta japonica]|uniref:Uncharacterized protein n=1 Tax=Eumeta variegata TaxID=151549 RepID=A0A4C1T8C7_EUMVA|nr:hypothetical protein EVAR_91263_1 [Eumeta japonica]
MVKKSKSNNQPEVKVNTDMEVEAAQAPPPAAPAAPSQPAQGQAATSAQMVTDGALPDQAVRVADDGIKMICPNVETFRVHRNLVDNKNDQTRRQPFDGARDSHGPTMPRKSLIFELYAASGIRVEAPFKRAALVNATGAKIWSRGRELSRGPLRQMSGPTLDQRVPAHSGVAGETLLC